MRPGGPEGGQKPENEGRDERVERMLKILENIDYIIEGRSRLIDNVRTASELLNELSTHVKEHMQTSISMEEMIEKLRPVLSRVDEWMSNILFILPQIEVIFLGIVQETRDLLDRLEKEKEYELLVNRLRYLFEKEKKDFENLIEILINMVLSYIEKARMIGTHFAILEIINIVKNANELLERLNQLKKIHFSQN
jgi:hypothetical protein